MKEKNLAQSDYMTLQLLEIESFRRAISHGSEENITFQEAIMLWISHGYADDFKQEYLIKRRTSEPALA